MAVLRGSYGDVYKEADGAYSPRFLDNPVASLPPRVVLEVGYSESMAGLRRDAELWLTGGEGAVHTVILIKIEPSENNPGVINHSRRFTCQVWHYDGVEEVRRRRAPYMWTAEPAFAFSEEFCEGQIGIPFSDLVEERPGNRDHGDFIMTPEI